jgi:lysozyme family protein
MAILTKNLAREYGLLYESCLIRPNRRAEVNRIVRRMTANRRRYDKVAKALKMPWYVVAVIHNMEAGMDFTRHLHNGDPLTARTTHVPAGPPEDRQAAVHPGS